MNLPMPRTNMAFPGRKATKVGGLVGKGLEFCVQGSGNQFAEHQLSWIGDGNWVRKRGAGRHVAAEYFPISCRDLSEAP